MRPPATLTANIPIDRFHWLAPEKSPSFDNPGFSTILLRSISRRQQASNLKVWAMSMHTPMATLTAAANRRRRSADATEIVGDN
jgi:hypothetical protein